MVSSAREAIWNENRGRVVWFKSFYDVGFQTSVGLSLKIVDRMK